MTDVAAVASSPRLGLSPRQERERDDMSGFTVTYRARDARGHAITLRKNLATLVEAADFALGLPDKYWSAPRVEMAR